MPNLSPLTLRFLQGAHTNSSTRILTGRTCQTAWQTAGKDLAENLSKPAADTFAKTAPRDIFNLRPIYTAGLKLN